MALGRAIRLAVATMGLTGWRSEPVATQREHPREGAMELTAQPFVKHDLSFSRVSSVPFSTRNETVAPVEARLSAATKRENKAMPSTENGTVPIARQQPATNQRTLRVVGESTAPPRRQRNVERRPREYLTPAEVETLIATAKKRGRYGHRDATMILIAYRHGLRVGELCTLRPVPTPLRMRTGHPCGRGQDRSCRTNSALRN
jgi:integrase